MELGLLAGAFGSQMNIPIDRIRRAESAGFTSVWTAEAYGSDAVSTAAWILAQTETIKVGTAIMQMPARSPAMTAMTAMTLNQLSGGRFLVGLGPSGPQVIDGLARRRLRTAAHAHEGVHRDHAQGLRPGRAGHPRRLPLPVAVSRRRRDGSRQAAQEHPGRGYLDPDLHRLDQPERARVQRRSGGTACSRSG